MNQKLILGTGVVLVVGAAVFLSINKKTTEIIQKGEVVTNSIPLPQETDIVRNFLTLIDEGKPSEAVMMMTSKITNDDSTKQAYGVQFNAMKSVKVVKVEESSKSDWTDSWRQYMVTLEVVMDPSSASGPIPFYGFDKGENIRFVTLIKEGGQWKVDGLSTGP